MMTLTNDSHRLMDDQLLRFGHQIKCGDQILTKCKWIELTAEREN